MLTLRDYQNDAFVTVKRDLLAGDNNALIVVPTGGGKTAIIAALCQYCVGWNRRVIVLAHVKELLEQTYKTLKVLDETLDVGLYCAGLDKRDTDNKIICASIQSVYNRAEIFGRRNMVIIDEAHLIPKNKTGMYRQLIQTIRQEHPAAALVGLTATPYRLDCGLVYGEGELFAKKNYEIDVLKLIEDKYLSPLISRNGSKTIDEDKLTIVNGEFDIETQGEQFSNDELIDAVIDDILSKASDRKKILVFCPNVGTCHKFSESFELKTGIPSAVITGDTDKQERKDYIEQFRDGDLKILVNCQVLTTGFDAPNIDCICLLRATTSPGLYCQMVGRGLRKAEGKEDCLILDYGKNIERHGPINDIHVRRKGEPRTKKNGKECPACGEVIGINCRKCPACGYMYPEPKDDLNIESESSDRDIICKTQTYRYTVTGVTYTDPKDGKQPYTKYIQAIYFVEEVKEQFRVFLGIEYEGYAREKFEKWYEKHTDKSVRELFGNGAPESCTQFQYMAERGVFAVPEKITVKYFEDKPFPEVIREKITNIPTVEDVNAYISSKKESGYY